MIQWSYICAKIQKTLIQIDACRPVFIAALFTIANIWKQPKCPLTDEWIKMWHIYTMQYYSALKKEWVNAICNNTNWPRNYHTKWSKSERERQISFYITYLWILKYDTNELTYKNRNRSRKQTYGYERGTGFQGGIN